MIKSDFHMHTRFSSDSDTPVEIMVERAIEIGLKTICFTDHNDRDFPLLSESGEREFALDVDSYFNYMDGIRERYKGKIDVRIGVEIGMQAHLNDYYKKMAKSYPFDFIIGSMHLVNGQDPYYTSAFEGKTDSELYRDMFRQTLENVRINESYDVLGHLDYIVRYGRAKDKEYSYAKFAEEIDAILKVLIQKGKGMEVNTAGYKYGLPFCHPHPDVLRRYRQLGGEIVTIGADGHRPEHIAYDFEKVSPLLKKCGFEYYAEFKHRKPIFKELP